MPHNFVAILPQAMVISNTTRTARAELPMVTTMVAALLILVVPAAAAGLPAAPGAGAHAVQWEREKLASVRALSVVSTLLPTDLGGSARLGDPTETRAQAEPILDQQRFTAERADLPPPASD